MEKQQYDFPEVEIVAFDKNDVVVTSGVPLPDDEW